MAKALLARVPEAQITFVGTARGLEARVVPREGFELALIRSTGLKGTSPVAFLRGAMLLPLSASDAWRILTRYHPDLVIGLGGYSSGPVVLLAACRGVRTVLLEQNVVPGFTNRRLARVIDLAAVTFEASLPYFRGRAFVSGNPVRPEFFAQRPERDGAFPVRVLVFGGSQGAHAINRAMVEAAPALTSHVTAGVLAITHQTGPRDLEMVQRGYADAGCRARVEPFLFAMAEEMLDADLVVCRAGATTLAEIAAAARPAILVPLPTATDDHQRRNAEALAAVGAASVLDQRELTGGRLAAEIVALARDADRRRRLSAAVRRFARPDAAGLIAERALALVGRR